MRKVLALLATLLLAACLFGCANEEPPDPNGIGNDEAAITQLVGEFGAALKEVSLLAPAEVVRESMREYYGAFVSEALLAQWQADPDNAPGRLVSSPWPDRIEVLDIEGIDAGTYAVRGEIVEITSADNVGEGEGIRRPVTLTVKKTGDDWRIDAVTLGAYPGSEQVVYSNAEYGFTFTLPAGWAGYEIVVEQWEGTALGGSERDENGPQILIRHPQWTTDEPRQDIPIMVFTVNQWEALRQEEFSVGAAPIPPRELGRNSDYVFALPARYNFAFPTGYEEVEQILAGDALFVMSPQP